MINSVTVLGSSSGRNAGDAALISGIMNSVDAACGRKLLYEIPTIKPNFISSSYPNRVQPISMLPWSLSLKMLGLPTYNSINRTDLSLVFDAILFDRSLYNPLFNYLSTLAFLLPRAKKRGKMLGFYNVTAGPVSTDAGKRMLRELADCMDFITVRDEGSFKVLADIGVKNPRILLTADAALNCPPAPKERVDQILSGIGLLGKEFLAININAYMDTWAKPGITPMGREKFLSTYATALNGVIKQIGVPVLFVSTQHLDVDITRDLMGRITAPLGKFHISNVELSHYEVQGVLGRAALLFAMRLHAMILASSQLTPVAGIAYLPKNDFYFGALGLPELSMSFDDFSAEGLSRNIIGAWEKRQSIRTSLIARIPVLQREANKAAELVAALDRGEDLDKTITRLNNLAAGSNLRANQ